MIAGQLKQRHMNFERRRYFSLHTACDATTASWSAWTNSSCADTHYLCLCICWNSMLDFFNITKGIIAVHTPVKFSLIPAQSWLCTTPWFWSHPCSQLPGLTLKHEQPEHTLFWWEDRRTNYIWMFYSPWRNLAVARRTFVIKIRKTIFQCRVNATFCKRVQHLFGERNSFCERKQMFCERMQCFF